MNKKTVIAIALLILLSTIFPAKKINISKFNLKTIKIENNFLIKDSEIKKLLVSIYDRNLIFLKSKEIEEILMQNNFIEGFNIKKKYPNTLKIKIFEKKPIAILIVKKRKFYLSDKIDLIEFKNIKDFENLPLIFGNKDEFKVFYENLKSIDFPFELIKKYTLYNSKRWDLETINKKTIRLPIKNYNIKLINYLSIKDEKNFKTYKVFDYRIKDQLILK